MAPNPSTFDSYSENYDATLNRSIALSGEDREFYARGRIKSLARYLTKENRTVSKMMDFGCGDGASIPLLLEYLNPKYLIGIDASTKSLDVARARNSSSLVSFLSSQDQQPTGELDLVYSNGVFHHIPPLDRKSNLDFIWRSLKPKGLFAFWENNPWNPGTRLAMWLNPFDREAVPIRPGKAISLLETSGFKVLAVHYEFFFPRFLAALRPWEGKLKGFPLGAQYLCLAEKQS